MDAETRTATRHRKDSVLFSCGAVYVDSARPEKLRSVTHLMFALFVILAFGTVQLAMRLWVESPVLVLGAVTLLLGWKVFCRVFRPRRRGRLSLLGDELVFAPIFSGRLRRRITLTDVQRIGRKGRRIHICLHDRRYFYFDCSHLHGEDLYDRLHARLEELGVEVVTYESKRHG